MAQAPEPLCCDAGFNEACPSEPEYTYTYGGDIPECMETDSAGVSNVVGPSECCVAGFETDDIELLGACQTVNTYKWEDWESVDARCSYTIEAVHPTDTTMPNREIDTVYNADEQECCDDGIQEACDALSPQGQFYYYPDSEVCTELVDNVDVDRTKQECCDAGVAQNDADLMAACSGDLAREYNCDH